ncbi:unnamed protein product [Linum tenue]|uniref:Uncharacterized protein n=1 Tax=Linum tenue TaxID=586396 RepID=A0AAV0NVG7_9ROSI|nr:unnamed protein product [Linum tenue]
MTSGDEEKIRRFSSLERSPEKVNLGGRKVNLKSLSPLSTVILQILVWLAGGFLGQSLLMEKRRARSKFFHISYARQLYLQYSESTTKGPFGLGDFVIEFAYGFAFDSRTEEASEWDQCSYAPDA